MDKTELLTRIDTGWAAFAALLDRLGPAQWTTRDSQGWSTAEHVAHLARWEMSAACLLTGQPRHVGLGIDDSLYLQGPTDAINAEVYRQVSGISAGDARAALADAHRALLAALAPLSSEDLQRRYRSYLPDEPGEGDGPLALEVVLLDWAEHYREHTPWVLALTEASGPVDPVA